MPSNKKIKKIAKTSPVSQEKTSVPPQPGEQIRHVFEKFKKHFEPAKVDEFQEKWLTLPENRKKYEKITDAPQVAIEEVIAMTNDLIDYIQGEKTGKSGLIKKIKTGFSNFFKNPAKFVQEKAEAGKEAVVEIKESAQDKVKEVTVGVKSTTKKAVEIKKKVNKKLVNSKIKTEGIKKLVKKKLVNKPKKGPLKPARKK